MSDETRKRARASSRNAQVKSLERRRDKRSTVRVAGSTIDIIRNPDQIKDWDEEELERGRRRDKNGRFTGVSPTIIPMECFRELNRRRALKAQQEFSKHILPAIAELRAIVDSKTADPKDKINAIKILLDRGLGKEGLTVDIHVETPKWLTALQGGIVAVDGDDAEDIEDAEVIWDSDDEEVS